MVREIRKVIPSDVDRLISCLTNAFNRDPLINWIVRQDKKRLQGFSALFRTSLCILSLPHGEVLTTNDYLGCALWYPPGKSKIGLFKQISLLPHMIHAASLSGLLRIVSVN
jgi:hypothetical protein